MPHLSNNVSVGAGGSGGEDATSDEVKIFTEEGTEETEKRDSERGLDEEKTSLVNISDSDKLVPSSNFFLPQGSIFGTNPFHLATRYKGENGKLLDPTALYGNGEAFRYFIPPYPHHNGYHPMGFRPSTNSLAQLMLYNQEHFAQPPPAHMGIPTVSIDPKSGMPRLSPYAFPSAHQYSHPGAVYATDFRQGSWPSPGLYPISTSTFPPMPYSPGPGFPPNFAKYSPPILSPVTPASPYPTGMSPAFGPANSIKGDYMYPDLKSSPHFPIDPHHPLHAAAAFGLAAAAHHSSPHHHPHHTQQLLHGHHHHHQYGPPVHPGQGVLPPPPTSIHHHPHPFFMGPPPHPLHPHHHHHSLANGMVEGKLLHHHSTSATSSSSASLAAALKHNSSAGSNQHHHPDQGHHHQHHGKNVSTSHQVDCGTSSSSACQSSGPCSNQGGTTTTTVPSTGTGGGTSGKKKKGGGGASGGAGTGTTSSQNSVPHIKKPLNAFMLFMKDQRSKVMEECTLKESSAINQLLGRKWHGLTREEQAKYYEMARKERQLHMQLYPGWTARDNYTSHNCIKKRKKKREKAIDPIDINDLSASKKCRARYGIEQQSNWCKPCRRKKKCIKFIDDSDSNNNDDIDCGDDMSQNSNSISSPTTAALISTAYATDSFPNTSAFFNSPTTTIFNNNATASPPNNYIPNPDLTTDRAFVSMENGDILLYSSQEPATKSPPDQNPEPLTVCTSSDKSSIVGKVSNVTLSDSFQIGELPTNSSKKTNTSCSKNNTKDKIADVSKAQDSKKDIRAGKLPGSHKSHKGSNECDCCQNDYHHLRPYSGFMGVKSCKNMAAMLPPLPLNPYYFPHPHPYYFAGPAPPPLHHTLRRHKNSSPYFTFTNEREEELLEEGSSDKNECCHEDYDGGSPLSPLSLSPPPPDSPPPPPPQLTSAHENQGPMESSLTERQDIKAGESRDGRGSAMPQLKVHPSFRGSSSSKAARSAKMVYPAPAPHYIPMVPPEAAAAAAAGFNFYNHGMHHPQYGPFVPAGHRNHHPRQNGNEEKMLKSQLKKQHREHATRCTEGSGTTHKVVTKSNRNKKGGTVGTTDDNLSEDDVASSLEEGTDKCTGSLGMDGRRTGKDCGKKCRCRPTTHHYHHHFEEGSSRRYHNPYLDYYNQSKGMRTTPPNPLPPPFPPPDYYFYNYVFNGHRHNPRTKRYASNQQQSPPAPAIVEDGAPSHYDDGGRSGDNRTSVYTFEEGSDGEGLRTKSGTKGSGIPVGNGKKRRLNPAYSEVDGESVNSKVRKGTIVGHGGSKRERVTVTSTIDSSGSSAFSTTGRHIAPTHQGISSPRITSNTCGEGTTATPSPCQPPDSSSDHLLHKIMSTRPKLDRYECDEHCEGGAHDVSSNAFRGDRSGGCSRCGGDTNTSATALPTDNADDLPQPNNNSMTALQDDDNLHYYHYEGGDNDQLIVRPEDGPDQEEVVVGLTKPSPRPGKLPAAVDPPVPSLTVVEDVITAKVHGSCSLESSEDKSSVHVEQATPAHPDLDQEPSAVVNSSSPYHHSGTVAVQRLESGSCGISFGDKVVPMLSTSSPLKQKAT